MNTVKNKKKYRNERRENIKNININTRSKFERKKNKEKKSVCVWFATWYY